jgi:hypothetical protein
MKAQRGVAAGNGPCRSLTLAEIDALREKIVPPLTKQEMLEKERANANMPDMSHLTYLPP